MLFTQKGREIEDIPSIQDALAQHLLRVGYEAGHVWGQAMTDAPQLPKSSSLQVDLGELQCTEEDKLDGSSNCWQSMRCSY